MGRPCTNFFGSNSRLLIICHEANAHFQRQCHSGDLTISEPTHSREVCNCLEVVNANGLSRKPLPSFETLSELLLKIQFTRLRVGARSVKGFVSDEICDHEPSLFAEGSRRQVHRRKNIPDRASVYCVCLGELLNINSHGRCSGRKAARSRERQAHCSRASRRVVRKKSSFARRLQNTDGYILRLALAPARGAYERVGLG